MPVDIFVFFWFKRNALKWLGWQHEDMLILTDRWRGVRTVLRDRLTGAQIIESTTGGGVEIRYKEA